MRSSLDAKKPKFVTPCVVTTDQYDSVCTHTQKGLEFLERYGSFIKERCVVEQEYASKLRKLSKAYQPKKKEEEDYQFTTGQAFKTILQELSDQAGQHEVIAENLAASVVREIATIIKELKEERKKAMNEGAKLQLALSQQLAALERAQRAYEKAHKEAEKAEEAYKRADADLNLSRAEVEKHRSNSGIKSRLGEDAKNEYAQQLQKSNELQNLHYGQQMPAVFDELQSIDRRKTEKLAALMLEALSVERSVLPIVQKCHDGMESAANSISYPQDTKLVIDRFKTGLVPPQDIPFQDLSANGDDESQPSTPNGSIIAFGGAKDSSFSVRGTVSAAGKLKHRKLLKGLFAAGKGENQTTKEDYSDLPPVQRKKKLQQKLDEINAKILQETATRDGLMKMKGVYEQNRALGDPMSIEGQLVENGQRSDKLRTELNKYQGYMDDAEGRVTIVVPSPQQNGVKREASRVQRASQDSQGHSGSDGSLSRSASDSSVSNTNVKISAPNTPQPTHGSSRSPESGIGTSHNSLPDSDPSEPEEPTNHHPSLKTRGILPANRTEVERLYTNAIAEIDDGDIYEEFEPLPLLGTCKALYSFEDSGIWDVQHARLPDYLAGLRGASQRKRMSGIRRKNWKTDIYAYKMADVDPVEGGESDGDEEVRNLDLPAQVGIGVDLSRKGLGGGGGPMSPDRGQEQERPMSWEGELSDEESNSQLLDDVAMDLGPPNSPKSTQSEQGPTTLPEFIGSLPQRPNTVLTTPLASPLITRHPMRPHMPLHPPTPSPDSAIHSAYYSPTASPSVSRHQRSGSSLSSPFSHLHNSPNLSRNNSDASQYSQYGGSSYSSAPSPLSPSPSQSPVQHRHVVLPRMSGHPSPMLMRHPYGMQPSNSLNGAFSGLTIPSSSTSFDVLDENSGELSDEKFDPGHSSLAASQSGISRQQLINSPCPICGDKISGFHYGIFSCESCKGFFKRTVQNKKNYVCLRGASCPVTVATRKKCPACRFEKCLTTGMKLEAIREDRTRGGRSTYQCHYGVSAGVQSSPSPAGHRSDMIQPKIEPGCPTPGYSEESQWKQQDVKPVIPSLLLDIMRVEHLWHITEQEMNANNASRSSGGGASGGGAPETGDYLSSLCSIADHRLYKIVKWCKSLPLFRNIQIEDQIALLINTWCELLFFACCYRSVSTPGHVSVSMGRSFSVDEARQLGIGSCIERMVNFADHLRRLRVDQYEYMALKVIILLSSDSRDLKDPESVRVSQESVLHALQQYTVSHYPQMPSKFGELLLRIPELERTCQIGKDMLSNKRDGDNQGFNLLFELLRGDH